jgi:hypothetical protein
MVGFGEALKHYPNFSPFLTYFRPFLAPLFKSGCGFFFFENCSKDFFNFFLRGGMDIWEGVAMDYLKFYPGLPCPNFYALRANHP